MEAAGGSKPTVETPGGPDGGRLLVVTAVPLSGGEALDRIRAELRDRQLYVVSPALADSAFEHAMGSVDDAIAIARERLEKSLEALKVHGVEAEGQVGDSDPLLAIEDALRLAPAGQILIVTRSEDTRWLEDDLFERARQRFEPEILHLEVDPERTERVADVERDEAGADAAPDAEFEGRSRNLPRFTVRDIAGIVIAVVGTLIAIIVAAGCDDGHTLQRTGPSGGVGTDGSCVAALVVAGATALINAAHIVALFVFESVGYRGAWARHLAIFSLVGTPLAVIAVILLAA